MNTPNQVPPYNDRPGLAERLSNALRVFGMRALAHTVSICGSIALIAIVEPTAAEASGEVLAFLSGYTGLVCLLSREVFKNADGRLAFGVGIVQTIISAILGAPLHGSLLLGGAQTFLQCAFNTKGRLGSAWIALPFIFIFGLFLLSGYNISFESVPATLLMGVASFAGVAAAARAFRRFMRRSILRPRYIGKLSSSIKHLEGGLASRQLPAPLQQQVQVLLGESRQYLNNLPPFDRQTEKNIICLEQTAQRIIALAARKRPKLWDYDAGVTHNAVLRSSNMLRPWLFSQAATFALSDLPPAVQAQEKNVDKLLSKINLLPLELRPLLETICRSAQNILDTVREKPQEESSAMQFLNRYLGAAHRISDELIHLLRSKAKNEEISNQIARSKDLLERLETAFASEHAFLMQTDVINLNAELGVLDSLLKMDGH